MQRIGGSVRFGSEILNELRDMKARGQAQTAGTDETKTKTNFIDHLKDAIEDVNKTQIASDQKATDLANGKDTNIHETMLSASQAELSFNLMVQTRNKVLEAYQEVMRMPV